MNDEVIRQFFQDNEASPLNHRCGYVTIIGRPNVGKSTLLNHLLGQKLSITSRKPQTTRHRILGIYSTESLQILFVDTPGMHQQEKKAINRIMNRSAQASLREVSAVLWVVDARRWTEEDEWILEKISSVEQPIILVLNKIYCLTHKEQLLPLLQQYQQRHVFHAVVPTSALNGHNLDRLLEVVSPLLPLMPPVFPADQLTDRSQRFLAAELVREKVMRQLGEEVPYEVTVEIESFEEEERLIRIHALILVERDGQKAIVIGDQGSRLKSIGTEARKDMEKLFERKVMLHLWVKVKSGWSDDERALLSLGYGDGQQS